MNFHLQLSFNKSKSKDLQVVLKNAREFDYFKESDSYLLEIYSVAEIFQKWENFNVVYHYCRRWSGTDFSINGVTRIGNTVFYALQEIKDCYNQYLKAYDKRGFCSASEWGCYKLKAIGRFIDESFGPYWYDYGRFINERTWKIDKARILNILTEETKQKHLHFCPVFNEYKITAILLRLPDEISVDGSKWQKSTKIEYRENGPVRVPVGIVHGPSSNYEGEVPEFFNEYPDFEIPDEIDNETANRLIELHQRHKSNQ